MEVPSSEMFKIKLNKAQESTWHKTTLPAVGSAAQSVCFHSWFLLLSLTLVQVSQGHFLPHSITLTPQAARDSSSDLNWFSFLLNSYLWTQMDTLLQAHLCWVITCSGLACSFTLCSKWRRSLSQCSAGKKELEPPIICALWFLSGTEASSWEQPAGSWDRAFRAHTAVSQQRLGGTPNGKGQHWRNHRQVPVWVTCSSHCTDLGQNWFWFANMMGLFLV